ncbi:MAG: glutamine synthetase family protein [Arcanobacterium sp.]|nr:glutamine synthetase family protein [Arcanobacterium sp.]
MQSNQEYVLREIQEKNVRFIRLWFTDVSGKLKSVAIAPAELESAFQNGIVFDGSAIQGLTRVQEADMVLHPDPASFQILPWYDSGVTARMFCDIRTPDGEAAHSDPRAVLQRALDHAANLGFTFYAQPEIEFYLFHPETDPHQVPRPIDNGAYFDNVSRSLARNFRSEAVKTLEEMGVAVEFSHHEAGPGQNEIDLRRTDALTMADNLMTFRVVVDQIALQQGVQASFMPKPLIEYPGNGMHTNFSLFEGEKNAFFDPGTQFQFSRTGRKFISGLMYHAREITAVTNQHVNSYKRLWAGFEAPAHIAWGKNNQSALIRIPTLRANSGDSARLEYRALDSAANPYLAYAVILSAGLAGIENDYPLPEPVDADISALSTNERRALGIASLPSSLKEAIDAMAESDLVARTLGEDTFNYFLRNKHHEWEQYRYQVTPFERMRFM